MRDAINEIVREIYYKFNSACIIDYETRSIDAPECTLTFESADAMTLFLLNEIRESVK